MDIYLVGGAVRDIVMGREPKDYDYVVVGSSPGEMLALGFQQVGADFPVFLHPKSGEEYALARTERKSGKGYLGFTVDSSSSVTLEEDLSRRDLTMNAMAFPVIMNLQTGERVFIADSLLVDPYHGLVDIRDHQVLRHTSEAFAEDPVRVLRIARFAARYGFDIADSTMKYLKEMVHNGEVDELVPERVFAEFEKGLMEEYPERMIEVLRECGALSRVVPLMERCSTKALGDAAGMNEPFDVRFLIACYDKISFGVDTIKCSKHLTKLIEKVSIAESFLWDPATVAERNLGLHRIHDILRKLDVRRDIESVNTLLTVMEYVYPLDRKIHGEFSYDSKRFLVEGFINAFLSVDEAAIANSVDDKKLIPQLIKDYRVNALKMYWNKYKEMEDI